MFEGGSDILRLWNLNFINQFLKSYILVFRVLGIYNFVLLIKKALLDYLGHHQMHIFYCGVFISCCIPATTQTAHFCNIYSTFLQYFIMLLVAIFRLRKLVNLFFCRSSSVIWMVGRTSTLFLSPLISFGP